MTCSPALFYLSLIYEAHAAAHAFYGDLGLEPPEFAASLRSITDKHLGSEATNGETMSFCKKLHLTDLYLSIACARNNEAAWRQFSSCYDGYIHEVARFACSTIDAALELAGSIPSHIFFPDRSGRSRIANYDGRSSLKTWLRVIIKNRAIDLSELRWNGNEPIDCIPELADDSSLNKIQRATRAGAYEAAITYSLKSAVESLDEGDRRLLASKYIETLKAIEIAESLGVDPSTVGRQLSRVHHKARGRVTSILATKFLLDTLAIEECLEEIVENPAYSILELLG